MASNNGAAAPQKVIGPLDRVELNVGGVSFHSTVATLTAKSGYFASLLSGNYKETAGDGVTKVFLDQDPESFRKLLAFMREGMIDAAVLDRGALLLAEYLQMEELLVAVKARAYKNLQPGSLKMNESAAAEEFDKKCGGIRSALAGGILPGSIKEDPKGKPKGKKKFAILRFYCDYDNFEEFLEVMREYADILQVNEEGEEDKVLFEHLRLVGALNWLYSHGYTEQLDAISDKSRGSVSITFSGSLPITENENENEPGVFIPEVNLSICNYTKEFAMIGVPWYNDIEGDIFVVARDPNGNDSSNTIKISGPGQAWLGKNGYTTCETGLESLLQKEQEWMKLGSPPYVGDWEGNEKRSRYPYKIYSRKRYPLDEKENDDDQEMIVIHA